MMFHEGPSSSVLTVPVLTTFHQLGSEPHGTSPRQACPPGDGTGVGERSSSDGVQRAPRPSRTNHSENGKVAARSPPEPQRGGERHLPLQFGGHRVDHGDFAFRMEGYAAVLSRDGQGGALWREVARRDKFQSDTIETLEKKVLGSPTHERSHGSRSSYVHPWRSGNPGAEDPRRRPWKRTHSGLDPDQ